MANDFDISEEAGNAMVNAYCGLLNAGIIRIYNGTKPTGGPSIAITTQTLLAELTYGNPAFGAATGCVATANAITQDASANANGTASWFRELKADTTTAVGDGTVGTTGCDLNLSSTTIVAGVPVAVTARTVTYPAVA